jgi:predicted kinase
MKDPVLLIVCGLPYAGKTAMSHGMVENMDNLVHIDIDQIHAARGLGLDGEPVALAEWPMSYQIAYERAGEALGNGQHVIFDATNYSRAQRDVLRMAARRAGARSAVVLVDASPGACRERWRADTRGGMLEHEFERVVDRFERPTAAERVLIFLPGMDARDVVTGLEQLFVQ